MKYLCILLPLLIYNAYAGPETCVAGSSQFYDLHVRLSQSVDELMAATTDGQNIKVTRKIIGMLEMQLIVLKQIPNPNTDIIDMIRSCEMSLKEGRKYLKSLHQDINSL